MDTQKYFDIGWQSPGVIDLRGGTNAESYSVHELSRNPQREKTTQHIFAPKEQEQTIRSRFAERITGSELAGVSHMAALALFFVVGITTVNSYYSGLRIKNSLAETANSNIATMVDAVKKAALERNYNEAYALFSQVHNAFAEVESALSYVTGVSAIDIDKNSTYKKIVQLISESGTLIADIGKEITLNIEKLESIAKRFMTPEKGVSLTQELASVFASLESIDAKSKMMQGMLHDIPAAIIPNDKKEILDNSLTLLDSAIIALEETRHHENIIMTLLGDKLPQRYLVLFQNKHELRPTGGFIGSVGIFDLNDGFLTKESIVDVYDFDGQIVDEIEPPEEMKQLTTSWGLRDANTSPDFSVSAQHAAWLLEKGNGPSVDHVIAIDQSFIKDILAVIGPVTVEGIPAPITADDINFVLSYVVERKLEGQTTPKKILKKLYAALKEKIKEPENLKKVAFLFAKGIQEKRMQAFSFDQSVQNFFEEQNVAGLIKPMNNADYLNVISISVGGNKSDRYIEQHIEHNTVITEKGEVFNELHITKEHTWSFNDLNEWENILAKYGINEKVPGYMQRVMGRGENRSMMRVYVPHGVTLIAAEGIHDVNVEKKYDAKLGLDYFYFPMNVPSQTSKKISLLYTLPENLSFEDFGEYKMMLQHQAGHTSKLTKKVAIDKSMEPLTAFPENAFMQDKEHGMLITERELNRDQHFAIALKKK